jgi:Zn-dependent protease
MPRVGQGSIHLVRIAGIDVFLHWSWFVVAALEMVARSGHYSSFLWNGIEYFALFGIVLLHELGHSLACRQVGGTADRIMLWPLGGVAYVKPPQRPGATLWSIAAGPLVNIALVPILFAMGWMGRTLGWATTRPNAYLFLVWIIIINGILLCSNLLPIYPFDGGQILRSLLWFFMGRSRSLMVAAVLGVTAVLGMVGSACFLGYILWRHSWWLLLVAAFMLMSCWGGIKNALLLRRSEKLTRRSSVACPGCGESPMKGPLWKCSECGQGFDTFEANAVCPNCGAQYPNTMCVECQQMYPMNGWIAKAYCGVSVGDPTNPQ